MLITQVSVTYGGTQSLPEYSNAKVSITLTATVEQGEIVGDVEAALWEWARQSVQAQIDAALEANGRAAKYSAEPRYQVLYTHWSKWDYPGQTRPPQYVIIAPEAFNPDRENYGQRLVRDNGNLRLAHAQRVASTLLDIASLPRTLIDCSDGDLSRLAAALPPPPPPSEETKAPAFARVADADDDERDYLDEDDDDDE